jgi:serine/threonine protein kinase/Tfp pilus assembly protein PilF
MFAPEALRMDAHQLAMRVLAQNLASQSVLTGHLNDYERYIVGGGQESFSFMLVHRSVLTPQQAQYFVQSSLTGSHSVGAGHVAQQSVPNHTPMPSNSSALIANVHSSSQSRPPSHSSGAPGSVHSFGRLAQSTISGRQPLLTIPGYTLIDVLGEGGMGVVYEATNESGNTVAIKVIKNKLSSETAQKRFARERDVMGRLTHPNIVKIFDSGTCEQGDYIAMELLYGDALDVVMKEEKPGPTKALKILVELCVGVAFAHEKGVIHRDLKPSNIMITEEGQVKVMDFGLAKDLNRETVLTQEAAVLGTPHYLSPEQAKGEHQQLGPHSDVFSIGVIMYELLVGERPFNAQTAAGLYVRIAEFEPDSPHARDKSLMKVLSDICMKALRKNHSERYPTATALANDIQRVLAGEDFSVDGLASRSLQQFRRRPLLVASILLIIFLLATSPFIISGFRAYQKSQRRRSVGKRLEQSLQETLLGLKKTALKKRKKLAEGLVELKGIEEEINLFCKRKDGSEEHLQSVLRKPAIRKFRGAVYLASARFQFNGNEFRESLQSAIQAMVSLKPKSSDHVKAVLLAARSEFALGNADAALAKLTQASGGTSLQVENVLKFKAIVLEDLGEVTGAIQALDEALKLTGNSELTAEKGRLLAVVGRKKESEALFKSLLKKNRSSLPIKLIRARALEAQGRLDEASDLLLRTQRMVPKNLHLRRERTRLLVSQGRFAEAYAELSTALELSSKENVLLQLERAEIALAQGQTELARKDLDGVSDKVRKDEEVLAMALARIRLMVLENQLAKAQNKIKSAIQLFPRDIRVLKLFVVLNRKDDVSESVNRLVEIAPRDPWVLQHQARLLIAAKQYAMAEKIGKTMARRFPLNPRSFWVLATASATTNPSQSTRSYKKHSELRSAEVARGHGPTGLVQRLLGLGTANGKILGRRILRWIKLTEHDDCESHRLWSMHPTALEAQKIAQLEEALIQNPMCLPSHKRRVLWRTKKRFPDAALLLSAGLALKGPLTPPQERTVLMLKINLELKAKKAREALETIEIYEQRHTRKLFGERLVAAIILKDKAAQASLRRQKTERDGLFKSLLRQVNGHLRKIEDSYSMNKTAVTSIRLGTDVLKKILKIDPHNGQVRKSQAVLEIRASNAFAYILLRSRSVSRTSSSLPHYFRISHSARLWLNTKGIEVFIEEPAKEFHISVAEKYFCRALFNLIESLIDMGKNMERKKRYAEKALKDIEMLLNSSPDMRTAYLFRAYAHQLLGHPIRAADDYSHFTASKEDRVAVHYLKMCYEANQNSVKEAISHAQMMVANGFIRSYLMTNPGTSLLRDHPDFKKLLTK